MKLDRNPPHGGVFLEWVMGTYQIGMHHLLVFHAPIWFGVSGQSDHSIYHNEWCHYGNPLPYRWLYHWPITLAPSVYPGGMVHFLIDLLVYITLAIDSISATMLPQYIPAPA